MSAKPGQIWERKKDGKRVRVVGPAGMWLGLSMYRIVNVEAPERPRRSNLRPYRLVEVLE